MSGPGCEPSWDVGCGGCPCEECVCEWDEWCCWFECDSSCADICIQFCGGCADLSNCGDGECDAGVGENCDNCGGDCFCGENEVCFSGECCVPACDGLMCGDDGCGGSCGDCPPDLICSEAGQCVETPTCEVAQALHCNETVSGDTSENLDLLDDYSCTIWNMSGPEVGYSFTAAEDDFIEITMDTGSYLWDLDLMITEDICAAEKCIDYADSTLTMDVIGGTTYFIIVDGYGGDSGAFDLTVKCQSNCEPQCDGKNCGDDGCWGTCGSCDDGVCIDGICMSGPGCEPSWDVGCGGCPCEECVCAFDDWCCWFEWDLACVNICIQSCGGCADLTNCGDDECDGSVGENCSNCEADCPCEAEAVCFGGACCLPSCEGVECGTDGCGGDCGTCPVGEYCNEGACGPNDGCSMTNEIGCGGCLCEACVCDIWPECCQWGWDDLCVYFCEASCGGCGLLENCGDDICTAEEGENCGNCPGDCLCEGDSICHSYECCTPSCEGLMCGSDGCGGYCGDCYDGVCVDGICMSGPGCESSVFAGCGGCSCEACVCGMDSYCCSNSWDGLCVSECIEDCGGCADLSNCGDGVCDGGVGETCGVCPADCACIEGEVCLENSCCKPDCEGKECGDDGCGGVCGSCPCTDCEADENWCDKVEGLCIFLDSTGCSELMDCKSACDSFDSECLDQCDAAALPEATALEDAWITCLEESGYQACWDWQCVADTYGECLYLGVQCFEGENGCAWLYECVSGCPYGDGSCAGDCMWAGDLPAVELFWEFWGCYTVFCDEATDFDCMADAAAGICQAEYETCVGACQPDCDGKECGDDGCNGVCGTCEVGVDCEGGVCGEICVPECEGKECGFDGCKGKCGECEEGWHCSTEDLCELDVDGDVIVQPDGVTEPDVITQPDVEVLPEVVVQPDVPSQPDGVIPTDAPPTTDGIVAKDSKSGKDSIMGEISLSGDGLHSELATDTDAIDGPPTSKKKSGGCSTREPASSGALPLAALLLCLALLRRRRQTQ